MYSRWYDFMRFSSHLDVRENVEISKEMEA